MTDRTVDFSRTEHVEILTQSTLNGYKRLFGGKLMEWIDIVAAVVARRHSGKNVTTAYIDSLTFTAPAYANETIVLKGYITYAGRTSMEICVKTYVETLDNDLNLINTAYVIMVALDDNEKPTKIPKLILTNDCEKSEWQAALKRKELRKLRKNEEY